MLRTPFVRPVIGGVAVALLAATAGCGGDDTVTAPTLAATTVASTVPETVPTTHATTTTSEAAAPTTVPATTAPPTTAAPTTTTNPPAPTATTSPPAPPTTTASPPAPTTTAACREVAFNDVIRRGDCGSGVVFVQERLTVLGFPTAADGFFGPATEAVVKDFQTDRGLTPDGIVGANTWAALTEGGIGD